MKGGRRIVLDVGKTLSKLTLVERDGQIVARRERANAQVTTATHRALDVEGIEAWLDAGLRDFARLGPVAAIITVAHGAAAAIVRDGMLAAAPVDYEDPLPDTRRANYQARRDDYAETGSPLLPGGLNLGAQLHWLESVFPDLLSGSALIVPWPQYWGWVLSGVAASEVTSLGCHSDLWRPAAHRPSRLAVRRGWAARLAPLRHAGAALGSLSPEWVARTGLSSDTIVHTGLHDSNAALLAARGTLGAAPGDELTVLSTGTWFVAMRSPGTDAAIDLTQLPQARDVLVNVDVDGRAIPSARFMGGREIEILRGGDGFTIDDPAAQAAIAAALTGVIAAGSMILPGFTPGTGPFPNVAGRWLARPESAIARAAAIALYAALMADVVLDLIGARGQILIDGRFARAGLFVRALASLRPGASIWVADGKADTVYGACRLLDPGLPPPASPRAVESLDDDIGTYRAAWAARTGAP